MSIFNNETDLEDKEDFFYNYVDEDLSSWSKDHLEDISGELNDFTDKYSEKLDRRANKDLNDLSTQLEYYLDDDEDEDED